jgi:hypothetical protein
VFNDDVRIWSQVDLAGGNWDDRIVLWCASNGAGSGRPFDHDDEEGVTVGKYAYRS